MKPMDYVLNIAIFAFIFSVLATAADLPGGHLGLVAICYSAFFGLGAYAAALFSAFGGSNLFLSLLVGALIGYVGGLLVAILSIRIKSDFFVVGTLAFQVLIGTLLSNWESVTHGAIGISGVARPTIFGFKVESNWSFFALAAGIWVLVIWLSRRLTEGPFGRVMHLIREDEILAASLGKHVFKTKLSVLGASGCIAGVAGVLYAHYVTFVDPSSFSVSESVLICSMAITGGSASKFGPSVGACVLVILPELLRWFGLPAAVAGNVRQILYGLALVVLMMIRPNGLLGKYDLS
jgi:branched-chain amino acid transport system permease protein